MSNFPKEEETPSDNNPTREENRPQFKRPKFILIDDRQGQQSQDFPFDSAPTQEPDDSSQNEKEELKSSAKSPVSLRFLCVLGLVFCLVFGLGIFLWSIALSFLAAVSLFQNQNLNHGVRSFWKLYMHTVIAGLGFALGILSPTIGLGLIVLYFSVTGEVIENNFLHKIIKRSFNKF
jgi:hypothetical protein